MHKYLGLFLVLSLFLVGCSSPAYKILSADNVYYHYYYVYSDKQCKVVYNPSCDPMSQSLDVLWTKIDRAKDALKRGGSIELQLKDVKTAEKKVKEVFKK